MSLSQLGVKSVFSVNCHSRTKAALLAGEGDPRYPKATNPAEESTILTGLSPGIDIQPDTIASGTLAAETTPTTFGFSVDDDEFDLDCPTEGFSSIAEAIEDICQGKVGCLFILFIL